MRYAMALAALIAGPAWAATTVNADLSVQTQDPCRLEVSKFEQAIGFVRQNQGNQAAMDLKERLLPAKLEGSEVYAFADAGQVTYKSRLGFAPSTRGLSSAGGGMRLSLGQHFLIELEAAKALADLDPATPGGRGWRGVFSIKTVY